MNELGLGWAQPLSSPSGSLPPRRRNMSPAAAHQLTARTALALLVCTWVSACATQHGASVTPSAAAPPLTAAPPTAAPLTAPGTSGVFHAEAAQTSPTEPMATSHPSPHGAASHDLVGSPLERSDVAAESGATSSGAPSPALVATSHPSSAPAVPSDPELSRLLALGEGALRREDYATAVESFRKARRRSPESGQAVVGLVAARFGQLAIPTEYKGAVGSRDVKELLAALDGAAARNPNLGVVHLQRARLLVVLGQGREARISLNKAKALLPSEPEVHSLLAIVDLSEGHVPEALQGFATASELEPGSAERLSNWGTALLMHGDVQQAISVYRRAVSLAPNDARARGDLGTALLSVGDVNQAMPHLVRASELAPTKATFMNNLGYAHQLQADWAGAKQWYDKALAADPKLGSAWLNLGTLYAAQGQYDAAEKAFRKALALDPQDPRAIGNLEDLASLRASKRPAP